MSEIPSRVVITGIGLISPLGLCAWSTFDALCRGKILTDRCAGLPACSDPMEVARAVGCVGVAQYSSADPTVELAERVAREAATEAAVELRGIATYLASSKAATTALISDPTRISPRQALAIALGPHGYLAQQLCRRTGIQPVSSTAAACASGLVALHQAVRDLRSGMGPAGTSKLAMVIGTEAALQPLFLHSYRRLGVLAPLTVADYRTLPLDQRRCGFVPSELAAAVLLQCTNQVRPGQMELLDTAVACEAHDIVRPKPTMDALRHVAKRLLSPHSVALIHPHAPGTLEHDPAELEVYRSITQPAPLAPVKPDYYAVKGALGHGLGAAGLVSLVVACLCARAAQRPPMPWLHKPINVPLQPQACRLSSHSTQAVFAAGFGGHVAGAVMMHRPTGGRTIPGVHGDTTADADTPEGLSADIDKQTADRKKIPSTGSK